VFISDGGCRFGAGGYKMSKGRRVILFAALAAYVCAVTPGSIASAEPPRPHATPPPDGYIVVFKDSVERPGRAAQAQLEGRDAELRFVYDTVLNGYSAELSRGALNAVERDPRVKYVAPNTWLEPAAQTVPAGIQRISATSNASLDIDGADDVRVNADVAVLDTGVDGHPDLNVAGHTDCVPADGKPTTRQCIDGPTAGLKRHGTHVAGTVGAIDNGFGVVGVAPGARIWDVRVLGEAGGYLDWMLAGINWVTTHASEIEVVNMSLSGPGRSVPMEEAIADSIDAGVVYVVAAGNDSANAETRHPANAPGVITVSALADYDGIPGGKGGPNCSNPSGPDDTLATFSNWGDSVEVAAPGVCVYSTTPGNSYDSLNGTSMASPHVAGAAAVLASQSNPSSKQDVEAIGRKLVDGGSLDWTDTARDAASEPVVHLDDAPLTATEVGTGGVATGESTNAGLTATLYGAVTPRGPATAYKFEYGTSDEYGQVTPVSSGQIAAGAGHTRVSASLSTLRADQRYHYRLVATNGSGTTYGPDRTFKLSRWRAQSPTSTPLGADSERLEGVSCSTATFCMAVGNYADGRNLPLSYRLSNGQWVPVAVPLPEGATEGELNEVHCVSSSSCVAVGYFLVPSEATLPLVAKWNGSAWSLQEAATNPSGSHYVLEDVSCASTSQCIAVGHRKVTPPWHTSTFSLRLEDGEWTELAAPEFRESLVGVGAPVYRNILAGVSCSSASSCMAVGYSSLEWEGGDLRPGIMRWDGSTWALETPARSDGWLYGVACPSSSACTAVGGGPGSTTALEAWDGSGWSSKTVRNVGEGSFIDVSCTSTVECVAVGSDYDRPGAIPLVASWDGDSWRGESTPPVTQAVEIHRSVSCAPLSGCKAVGLREVASAKGLIAARDPFKPDLPVDSDFDADNRSDLIGIRSSGEVVVSRGTSQKISATSTAIGSIDPALYDSVGEYVVDSADVDGDRSADLVTVSDAGTVSVHRATDGGLDAPVQSELALPPSLSKAGSFEPVAVADTNADGKGDLIVQNVAAFGEHRVSTYMGRSNGTFKPAPVNSMQWHAESALDDGQGNYFLDVADVNGDGDVDLVSMATYGAVHVNPGESNGYFSPATINGAIVNPILDDGSGQEPIGVADVTGDGKADLLTHSAGKLKLYPGQAWGASGISFGEPSGDAYSSALDSSLTDGTGEEFVGLLDYSGDGRADLVAVTTSGQVKSYTAQSSPAGTFAAPQVVASGMTPTRHRVVPGYQFAVEKPIVKRQGCTPACRWAGLGRDSDVDGDRRGDLTTLHTSGSAYVFAGDPGSGFSVGAPGVSFGGTMDSATQDGSGDYVVDTADVNGDGRSDLVAVKATGGVQVRLGAKDRTFGSVISSLTGVKPVMTGGKLEPVGVADVTGDGRADLVGMENVFGYPAHVLYRGQADGTFNSSAVTSQFSAANSALSDGTGDYYVDVADVSGDGRADLVAIADNGTVRTFKGQTSNGFANAVTASGIALDNVMGDGAGYEPVGLGDVNGDGHADLALQHRASHRVFVLRGRVDGAFDPPPSGAEGWIPARTGVNSSLADRFGEDLVGLTDYDGDRRSDLISVTISDEVRAYRAQPDGTFSAPLISGPVVSNRFNVSPGHELVTEKPAWRRKPSVVPTSSKALWVSKGVLSAGVEAMDSSCLSASSCVAVGSQGGHAQALSWNGTEWSTRSTPRPAGAASSELLGVSCVSASACAAVGSYVDSGGVKRSLAMTWNGAAWSLASTAQPTGASSSQLNGVSCRTSSFSSCFAVGGYVDSAGVPKVLAMSGGTSSWSLVNAPAPSGASSSVYEDISCQQVSGGGCTAVGSYLDGGGTRRALATEVTFGAWGQVVLPATPGASSAELADVSCPTATTCAAVGSYVDAVGTRRSLAIERSPSGWSISRVPNPFGATETSLSGVSCSSAGTCTAVGSTTLSGSQKAFVATLEGDWYAEAPALPAGAVESQLRAVACTAAGCHALGRADVGGEKRAFATTRG
jgi:subtilisin family serine protease